MRAQFVDEEQWLACTDLVAMLEHLRASGKLSDRKLRLFSCACCRRVWPFLKDDRSRRAVEVSERYADGQANDRELLEAHDEANNAAEVIENKYRQGGSDPVTVNAAVAVSRGTPSGEAQIRVFPDEWTIVTRAHEAVVAAKEAAHFAALSFNPPVSGVSQQAECTAQAALVRCIFGTPHRPASFEAQWLTWNEGTVRRLAEAAYNFHVLPSGSLDYTRLAMLADALEEAGCADEELWGHLRGSGPHVRGCWVIDLLLGKE